MHFSLKKKVFFVVLAMAVALSVATIVVSYNIYANTMDAHYQQLTMNLARTAAQVVDREDVKSLTSQVMEAYRAQCTDGAAPDFDAFTEADWQAYDSAFDQARQSDAYARIFDTLTMLKEENGVLWMYICYMDEQTGKAVYIIDADAPEVANPSGYCDPIEANNLALMQQGIYDFPAYITNYEEYGWLCSAAAAITGEDGQVIANAYVDISMDEVAANSREFLFRLAGILAAAASVMIAAMIAAVNRTIVSPVNVLAKAAESFVSDREEHGDQRIHPEPDGGDGGKGAHRRGAGRGASHPVLHAALYLPGLSGPAGVRHLCFHGSRQRGGRRLLRFLYGESASSGSGGGGRLRKGRSGGPVHGHRKDPDQGPHPAGRGPGPGVYQGQRAFVRVQQRGAVHHRL